MRCTSPLVAIWYRPDVPASGDIVGFDKPKILSRYIQDYSRYTPSQVLHLPSWTDEYLRYVTLPCGKCQSCRMVKSSEWSYRCRMEQLYHPANSFLTLTVDDAHMQEIFPNQSLRYAPFQDFMKRLRERIGVKVRFLMCGEYGTESGRPHYHCLLFGYDFPDRELWSLNGDIPVYRSSLLESLWKFGFSTVGEMVPESINYVCRYVLKKLQSRNDYGDKLPEFIRMSLKPGIGAQFFLDYCGKDFYKKGLDNVWYRDYVMVDSFKMKCPRYFDKMFERLHSADFVSLKTQRFLRMPDMFFESELDLQRHSDYLSVVTKGRIKKEI